MQRHISQKAAICALLANLCAPLLSTFAQGTAFTYQGRLAANGANANGIYDLQFALFATNNGGAAFAGPVTNAAVAVSNGLFTTTVDFGNVFTGATGWLQLAVTTNGSGSFTTLAPRQQLTPVPNALWASAASNVLGRVPAAQLSGTIPAAMIVGVLPLGALPSAVVTNNGSGYTLGGSFAGTLAGAATNVTGTLTNNTTGAAAMATNAEAGGNILTDYASIQWSASGTLTNCYLITNSPIAFEDLVVAYSAASSTNGMTVYTNTAPNGLPVYLVYGDLYWATNYGTGLAWSLSTNLPDKLTAGYANELSAPSDSIGNLTNPLGGGWVDQNSEPVEIQVLALQPCLIVSNANYQFSGAFNAVGGNVLTNGSTSAVDPLAAAYSAANHLDPEAQDRLNSFCQRARTMSSFTNMVVHFLFNPSYAPQPNNADLFGNTITWNATPSFGPWGANLTLTNQGKILLPSQQTNWTIVVVKRNYWAGCRPGASAFPWENEFALENTNGDSFNFVWQLTRGGYFVLPSSKGALPYAGNPAAARSLVSYGSYDMYNSPEEVAPGIWQFESGGGRNVSGTIDLMPLIVPPDSVVGLTNLSPVQAITIGGSTNWQALWSRNNTPATDQPTNAFCEIFSVTCFNTAIGGSDMRILYTALNEEYPSTTHWIGLGDSMMAWGNNRVHPNDPYGAATNFVMFQFAQRHPLDNWHDWAQGGTTLSTFTNWSFSTWPLRLLPPSASVTIIEDLPRNDAMASGPIDADQIAARTLIALAPWKTNGANIWQYESPLPATNAGVAAAASPVVRANLVMAYDTLRTNGALINRFLHGIDYFTGSVWDTNNGYYGWPNGGFSNPGFHIEGTNSPLFMAEMAELWDTGEWPGLMPQLDPTLNGLQNSGNFAGAFTGNGAGLTSLNATQLVGVIPPASLPGITTNVSAAGITFYITNGLIMRVTSP